MVVIVTLKPLPNVLPKINLWFSVLVLSTINHSCGTDIFASKDLVSAATQPKTKSYYFL